MAVISPDFNYFSILSLRYATSSVYSFSFLWQLIYFSIISELIQQKQNNEKSNFDK